MDQMGFEISLDGPPQRIISIVPSQSEFLWDLGLENEITGITKFCIHPEEMFRTKPRIGGTKNLNIEKIRSLKPDLIIGNKEENEKEQVLELKKEFAVWMSDISSLEDTYEMMTSLGEITGREKRAKEITDGIKKGFQTLNSIPEKNKRCAYLIWKNPYMCAGGGTFIDHILNLCGISNVFTDQGRYPEISCEDLKSANPEIIFLSSEPYPFKEKHITEFNEICPKAKVMVVDGEMFSWYGSRLLHAPAYLNTFLSEL
jgi:ABC-type Fe3+-hydroxamate transport system substrate-binding protein